VDRLARALLPTGHGSMSPLCEDGSTRAAGPAPVAPYTPPNGLQIHSSNRGPGACSRAATQVYGGLTSRADALRRALDAVDNESRPFPPKFLMAGPECSAWAVGRQRDGRRTSHGDGPMHCSEVRPQGVRGCEVGALAAWPAGRPPQLLRHTGCDRRRACAPARTLIVPSLPRWREHRTEGGPRGTALLLHDDWFGWAEDEEAARRAPDHLPPQAAWCGEGLPALIP